jgi:hypothetical protein
MEEIRWIWLFPLIFLGVGAAFALLGIRGWRSQGSFDRRATARAPGVVTDLRYSRVGTGADSRSVAAPVVRFTVPDGRTVETEVMAVDHTGARWRRKGAEVTVVYDPTDPTSAALEGATTGGRILYAVFVAFGVIFVLIGVLALILPLLLSLALG